MYPILGMRGHFSGEWEISFDGLMSNFFFFCGNQVISGGGVAQLLGSFEPPSCAQLCLSLALHLSQCINM